MMRPVPSSTTASGKRPRYHSSKNPIENWRSRTRLLRSQSFEISASCDVSAFASNGATTLKRTPSRLPVHLPARALERHLRQREQRLLAQLEEPVAPIVERRDPVERHLVEH